MINLVSCFDKEKYMIHYENLKLETLLEVRSKAEKIHRVLEFDQSQWLKQYIEFNAPERIEAEEK